MTLPRWEGKAGRDCVGATIVVSGAGPASSDYLTEGAAYSGRVANCASDEMFGKARAFALCAIEGCDST